MSSRRLSKSYASCVSQLSSIYIPSNVHEALADPRWTKEILNEMVALENNNTLDNVTLPRGEKTLGCIWVLTIKHKTDGTIERYKACMFLKVTLILML